MTIAEGENNGGTEVIMLGLVSEGLFDGNSGTGGKGVAEFEGGVSFSSVLFLDFGRRLSPDLDNRTNGMRDSSPPVPDMLRLREGAGRPEFAPAMDPSATCTVVLCCSIVLQKGSLSAIASKTKLAFRGFQPSASKQKKKRGSC